MPENKWYVTSPPNLTHAKLGSCARSAQTPHLLPSVHEQKEKWHHLWILGIGAPVVIINYSGIKMYSRAPRPTSLSITLTFIVTIGILTSFRSPIASLERTAELWHGGFLFDAIFCTLHRVLPSTQTRQSIPQPVFSPALLLRPKAEAGPSNMQKITEVLLPQCINSACGHKTKALKFWPGGVSGKVCPVWNSLLAVNRLTLIGENCREVYFNTLKGPHKCKMKGHVLFSSFKKKLVNIRSSPQLYCV